MRHWKLGLMLFLLIVLLAACGSSSGEMEVNDVWGRTSPMAAANGAFYMQITNNTGEDDKLLSASTDACGTVELHEMYMKEGDVMGMRPVPDGYIALPKGEMVELKVGGLHVMCIGKNQEFNAGDSIPITLQFENAGTMEVTADIRDNADTPSMDMDMDGSGMEGMNNGG
ncbi:MAG: copper chaperone PCu(A)C [Ardenticatenaceae bacterium]|nr:copper chaperone PCu(A)C [Ardenticatenaceae bacterium]MCB8989738.1 copper chaperone PCu(A)C [Ardenticatenaceae bacterium]MCB9002803.1 copper chaperone PCu(A)C [Ardenticatenaceae bacterium]